MGPRLQLLRELHSWTRFACSWRNPFPSLSDIWQIRHRWPSPTTNPHGGALFDRRTPSPSSPFPQVLNTFCSIQHTNSLSIRPLLIVLFVAGRWGEGGGLGLCVAVILVLRRRESNLVWMTCRSGHPAPHRNVGRRKDPTASGLWHKTT